MKRLCLLTFVVACAVPALGQAPMPMRTIFFRDGSVLRLPVVDETLKITLVQPEGGLVVRDMRLSSLRSMTLAAEDGFVRNRALLSAVRQLGSDDFKEREQAFAELLKLGPQNRADLESCLKFVSDFEAQTRLKAILAKMPPAGPKTRTQVLFDLVQVNETLWGHLGDATIAVVVNGKPHRLSRRDIAGLSDSEPGGPTPSFPGPLGFRRIRMEEFPAGCTEEPFDKMPDGRPINIGDNIERAFLSRGFVLSTSIASSYVSVNGFSVQGKSRGLSAANHQPLWEGEITVRFVQPGRDEIPAGVTHFGCYIASVVPGGTALFAYDFEGRELGKIDTQNNGHEFLGVASSIPIHRVRFVPNPKLDRDYTLDDFIFTPPQSPEARHPEKFGATLVNGDRVFCSDVNVVEGKAVLEGMPAGLPNRTVRVEELQRVNLPAGSEPIKGLAAGVFAELRDGSILFGAQPADGKKPPQFNLTANPLQKRKELVGIWGSKYSRLLQAPKPDRAALWDAWERKWFDVSDVRLGDVEASWKGDTSATSLPYHKLGPLWFADPPGHPSPGWHLQTRHGDDLVLGQADSISGQLSRELVVLWQGQKLRLTPREASALFRVSRRETER